MIVNRNHVERRLNIWLNVQSKFLNQQCTKKVDCFQVGLFQWKTSFDALFDCQLMDSRGTNCFIKECANVNYLWASLIIEECVRLGLTVSSTSKWETCYDLSGLIITSLFQYFCIAPGSRSSPLAISACGHSSTTCISCFDERSLAFHAVGYARGSHKPAVVITSSGTAVSNPFPAVRILSSGYPKFYSAQLLMIYYASQFPISVLLQIFAIGKF